MTSLLSILFFSVLVFDAVMAGILFREILVHSHPLKASYYDTRQDVDWVDLGIRWVAVSLLVLLAWWYARLHPVWLGVVFLLDATNLFLLLRLRKLR